MRWRKWALQGSNLRPSDYESVQVSLGDNELVLNGQRLPMKTATYRFTLSQLRGPHIGPSRQAVPRTREVDPRNYIYTASGAKASPDANVGGVGTLSDIALALSRIPRFGGQTRRRWSVADHTLFMASLRPHDDPRLLLAVLLHDAHEAFTGDIPTAYKTDDIRSMQRELDVRIMNEFFPGGIEAYLPWKSAVKELDNRALVAEAAVVGPLKCTILTPAGWAEGFGRQPDWYDVTALYAAIRLERVGRDPRAMRLKWFRAVESARAEVETLGMRAAS